MTRRMRDKKPVSTAIFTLGRMWRQSDIQRYAGEQKEGHKWRRGKKPRNGQCHMESVGTREDIWGVGKGGCVIKQR